jgi:hypothetical protein
MSKSLHIIAKAALVAGCSLATLSGCGGNEPPPAAQGNMNPGAMDKDKMSGGAMDKDKMSGSATDKDKMGGMGKDKMEGTIK